MLKWPLWSSILHHINMKGCTNICVSRAEWILVIHSGSRLISWPRKYFSYMSSNASKVQQSASADPRVIVLWLWNFIKLKVWFLDRWFVRWSQVVINFWRGRGSPLSWPGFYQLSWPATVPPSQVGLLLPPALPIGICAFLSLSVIPASTAQEFSSKSDKFSLCQNRLVVSGWY